MDEKSVEDREDGKEKGLQLELRGDGKIPVISIEAENLAEATHKTIIECHDYGCRIETPKQKPGMTLGYDGVITVKVSNPDFEPKIYFPGIYDDGRGVMQYILEVTHGIHNHWKKDAEHPDRWGYTYNERFVDQLPFIFNRIKADWEQKKGEWYNGKGRPSGRDYQFVIWRSGEDIILEQEDPPCLQIGQIRLLEDKNGDIILNYINVWRSRDLLKAWNENNIGQIELMKLFRDKISNMLETEIKLGAYIDISTSLHLYGLYIDRDNLEKQIENMKGGKFYKRSLFESLLNFCQKYNRFFKDEKGKKFNKLRKLANKLLVELKNLEKEGYEKKSMSLDDYFMKTSGKDRSGLKRVIAAQMDAEAKGHGLNQDENTLKRLGYDLDNFPYPKEWDTWPSSWDAEPDRSKLARVP